MVNDATDFGRPLNQEEAIKIKFAFPDVNINNMRFLSEGFYEVENYDSELCQTFYCCPLIRYEALYKNGTQSFEMTNLLNSDQSDQLDICSDDSNEFECYYFEGIVATFNCIGWAMGISRWFNPDDLTELVKNGLSHEQAINKFIEDNQQIYPKNPLSNFANLIDKFTLLDGKPDVIANNTVIFYFKDDECNHASRYITDMNGLKINQWTSKAGIDELVSHDESELLSPEMYGTKIYYVGVVEDTQSN